MNDLMKLITAITVIFITASSAMGVTLSTNVTTDGGCEGAFFDVTAKSNDVIITGFETVLVGTADVRVYYKPGSYVGAENTAGLWTLLGSQNVVGGSGFIQTLYPLDNVENVTVPKNHTYGFLVYSGTNGGSGVLATRYRGFSTVTVDDPNISVFAGAASCSGDAYTPFDGSLNDRAWRGSVIYTIAPQNIPTLSQWGMIILSSLLALGAIFVLRRQRQ